MSDRMPAPAVPRRRSARARHRLGGPLSAVLLLSAALAGLAGCATVTTAMRDPGRLIGRPKAVSSVGRIITLWEAAEGQGVDGNPSRGFAGQILFFGLTGDTPVEVDGRVVIYEYDQYSRDQEDPQPLHSFTFEPDAWAVHGREGTLGHSYSVFIPYMQDHKQQVTCGLRVEFECADGRRISSDITPVLLQGRFDQATAAPPPTGSIRNRVVGGRPAESSAPTSPPPATTPRRQLESVTIPLPRR